MRYKLNGVGVLSAGTFFAIMAAIIPLLFGWPLILLDLVGASGFGLLTWIFLVVFSGVSGFVGGVVMALVYNILFAMTGGLVIKLEKLDTN